MVLVWLQVVCSGKLLVYLGWAEGDCTSCPKFGLLDDYPPALSSLHADHWCLWVWSNIWYQGIQGAGVLYKAHRQIADKSNWWYQAKSWSSIGWFIGFFVRGYILREGIQPPGISIYDAVIVICSFVLIVLSASKCTMFCYVAVPTWKPHRCPRIIYPYRECIYHARIWRWSPKITRTSVSGSSSFYWVPNRAIIV